MITEPNEFIQRLQELQNSSSVTYSTLPSNEPRFIIDANSRTIKIPPEFQFLGVKNDHKAETVYFEIDRYFDNEDLSTHTCVVQFENKSGEGGIYPVTIMDTESIDGKIIFGWEILSDATTIVGDIIFSVRFYSLDNYVFTYNFNTLPAKSVILDTLNVDDPTVVENYPSELEAWLDRMNDLSQNVVKPEDVQALDTKMDTLETSFGELETNVNSSVDELKSDLAYTKEYLNNYKWVEGCHIETSKDVVNLKQVTNDAVNCLCVGCRENDKFKILGSGGNIARLYCFIDKNNTVLTMSESNLTFVGDITAPSGATALIINARKDKPHAIYKLNSSMDVFNYDLVQETEIRLSTGPLLTKYYIDFLRCSSINNSNIEVLVQKSHDASNWENVDNYLTWTKGNVFCQQLNSININDIDWFRILFRKSDNSAISLNEVELTISRNNLTDYKTIRISAHNATEESKKISDFVCSGLHDEYIIRLAITLLRDGGDILLSEGDFYIDSFASIDDGLFPTAITLRNTNSYTITYNIKGIGIPLAQSGESTSFTKIKISDACYDSLEQTESRRYCVLRSYKNANIKFNVYNIGFHAKSNNKPVLYLCGEYSHNMCLDNVRIWNDDFDDLPVPNKMCVGVWGCSGSNPGVSYDWKKVFVFGCHEGFRCSGEHLILWQCGARTCTYGYTFKALPFQGTNTHPMTLINCCDELNTNLPYFGIDVTDSSNTETNTRQAITFIDYNIEWVERLSPVGERHFAREYSPNRFIGSIEYTVQPDYGYYENSKYIQFWEYGHGHGFKTRNQAHNLGGSSSERLSYSNSNAANYMQLFFDTDLNKMLVYDGSNWRDFNGNIV